MNKVQYISLILMFVVFIAMAVMVLNYLKRSAELIVAYDTAEEACINNTGMNFDDLCWSCSVGINNVVIR